MRKDTDRSGRTMERLGAIAVEAIVMSNEISDIKSAISKSHENPDWIDRRNKPYIRAGVQKAYGSSR